MIPGANSGARGVVLDLVRFHIAGAARVAQRNSIVGLCIVVFAIGSTPLPYEMVHDLALSIASHQGGTLGPLAVAALAAALASNGARTVTTGVGGWMRSLPATGAMHRRAAAFSLLIIEVPLILAVAAAAVLARTAYGTPLSAPKLTGAVLVFFAAATAAVPARNDVLSRPLALGAALLAALGSWTTLVLAVACYAGAEATAGGIRISHGRGVRAGVGGEPLLFLLRVVWQAIGWRLGPPFLGACLPIAFAVFYIRNNNIVGSDASLAVRSGGAIAMVIWFATLADVLNVRRAAWPWGRSLPWPSMHRVLADAAALALPALPLVIALASIAWRGALSVLAIVPLLSLIAIGATQRARERVTGAGGVVILWGTLVGVVMASSRWGAFLCLLATPLAAYAAARGERKRTATAWHERHHDIAGDSLSWTAR